MEEHTCEAELPHILHNDQTKCIQKLIKGERAAEVLAFFNVPQRDPERQAPASQHGALGAVFRGESVGNGIYIYIYIYIYI